MKAEKKHVNNVPCNLEKVRLKIQSLESRGLNPGAKFITNMLVATIYYSKNKFDQLVEDIKAFVSLKEGKII